MSTLESRLQALTGTRGMATIESGMSYGGIQTGPGGNAPAALRLGGAKPATVRFERPGLG